MSYLHLYVEGHIWEVTHHKMERSRTMSGFGPEPLRIGSKLTVRATSSRDLIFFKKMLESYEKLSDGCITVGSGLSYMLYGLIIVGYNFNTEVSLEITADFICDYFEPVKLTRIDILKRYKCSIKKVLVDNLNFKY